MPDPEDPVEVEDATVANDVSSQDADEEILEVCWLHFIMVPKS